MPLLSPLPQYPTPFLPCSSGCSWVKVSCQCVAMGKQKGSWKRCHFEELNVRVANTNPSDSQKGQGCTLWRKQNYEA